MKELPSGWTFYDKGGSRDLTYKAWRSGKGFYLALLCVCITFAFCFQQVFFFFKNWFIEKAEILPAGVILVLILLGILALCAMGLNHLFRSVSYRYSSGGSTLEIQRTSPLKKASPKVRIDRGNVLKVVKVYTPPKNSSLPGTWKTAIVYSDKSGKPRYFFLEGDSEAESNFLSHEISQWASVEITEENSSH
ncbi:MAG: hypothetical protein KDD53_00200 [Bdellovibrionales bacterium]|nr:hypothetical protein [Bdellovibrionales bacterium]